MAAIGYAWFMWSIYSGDVFGALFAGLAGGLVAALAMLLFVWVIGMFMEMMEGVRSIFD